MCKICAEYEMGKLTWYEAWTNLKETYIDDDQHLNEVWLKLVKEQAEQETEDSDQ